MVLMFGRVVLTVNHCAGLFPQAFAQPVLRRIFFLFKRVTSRYL